MNSCNWTFVGNHGYTCKIILKHGINSGNLIVFCNSKIMLIDYDVFGDADFSFFIEEEFCKIHVRKKKKGFVYDFEVVEDVDTPLNRKRKEYYRFKLVDMLKKAFYSMSIIVLIILTSFLYKRYLNDKDLQDHARVTTVLMRPVKSEGKKLSHNARYSFFHRKINYNKDKLDLETLADGTVLAGNGMPLENYDEFHIVYSHKKPYNNYIEYDKPTFFQLSRYADRLSAKIREQTPNTTQGKCDCLVKAVLETEGVAGFAHVYFQGASKEENPQHNQQSYERMVAKPRLAGLVDKCGL